MSEPTSNPRIDNTPWERYRRPYVRDLAYVLACPNVLTRWLDFAPHQSTHTVAVHSAQFWQTQFEAYEQRLTELDTTAAYQELTRYLLKRPSPNRLGFHFEGLLSFWLEDGFARKLHPYETLASNVQLYNGKQTTGCGDYDWPYWLTPSFPIHEWCDKRDMAGLATIDTIALRAAHYIEWFTKRDFYDERNAYGGHQQPIVWSDNEPPRTGLYFEGNRPIVIYPRWPNGVDE